jgi:hypothetical protein
VADEEEDRCHRLLPDAQGEEKGERERKRKLACLYHGPCIGVFVRFNPRSYRPSQWLPTASPPFRSARECGAMTNSVSPWDSHSQTSAWPVPSRNPLALPMLLLGLHVHRLCDTPIQAIVDPAL